MQHFDLLVLRSPWHHDYWRHCIWNMQAVDWLAHCTGKLLAPCSTGWGTGTPVLPERNRNTGSTGSGDSAACVWWSLSGWFAVVCSDKSTGPRLRTDSKYVCASCRISRMTTPRWNSTWMPLTAWWWRGICSRGPATPSRRGTGEETLSQHS